MQSEQSFRGAAGMQLGYRDNMSRSVLPRASTPRDHPLCSSYTFSEVLEPMR